MAGKSKASQALSPDNLSDPVDWAGHYWTQQDFAGDETRFLAVSSLLRYQRIVFETIDTELRGFGINMTDYLMLMTLQLSESGTRLISSLARNLMVHATTATLAIDRLEAKDLLSRSPHPTDRRATCVTISTEGRRLVSEATKALDAVEFGMQNTEASDISELTAVLARLREAAGDRNGARAKTGR